MFSESVLPAHMTSVIATQVQLAIMQGLQRKTSRTHNAWRSRKMAYDAAEKAGIPEGQHVRKPSHGSVSATGKPHTDGEML